MSQQYRGAFVMPDTKTGCCFIEKMSQFALFISLIVIFGSAAHAQAVNLPETGQNTCYS
jgi:hypothetical protein